VDLPLAGSDGRGGLGSKFSANRLRTGRGRLGGLRGGRRARAWRPVPDAALLLAPATICDLEALLLGHRATSRRLRAEPSMGMEDLQGARALVYNALSAPRPSHG